MEISLLLKKYRKENNLTLREFATKCGTSHSYIAMLENGKNSKTNEPIVPSITMLKKISHGMGISINDLITLCDDMPITLNGSPSVSPSINLQLFAEAKNSPEEPKLTEGEKMLIDLFRQIPEDAQKMYLEVLRAALKNQS